jgi:sulfoxide reductase catalytic subunit YedY
VKYAGVSPLVEGLRMDEAMHPLALLCFGMYGDPLPNQNGAPIRMVVPWKYGFKSIKSIVKIRFVEKQPFTSWMKQEPLYYGFYSNVNPAQTRSTFRDQSTERRLGEFLMRKTLPFLTFEIHIPLSCVSRVDYITTLSHSCQPGYALLSGDSTFAES